MIRSEDVDRRFWNLSNRRRMILLADVMKAYAMSDDYNPHIDSYVPLTFFGSLARVMSETDPAFLEKLAQVEQMKLKGKSMYIMGHMLEEKE